MLKSDKMKPCCLVVIPLLLSACAETVSRQSEAMRDFIDIEQLQEQDEIRTSDRDRREVINADFIIYKAKNQDYLIEFRPRCPGLVDRRVVADRRWSGNRIRPRFDTINGCLIAKAYALSEEQANELQEIAEYTE
jgi:hypothetical protein